MLLESWRESIHRNRKDVSMLSYRYRRPLVIDAACGTGRLTHRQVTSVPTDRGRWVCEKSRSNHSWTPGDPHGNPTDTRTPGVSDRTYRTDGHGVTRVWPSTCRSSHLFLCAAFPQTHAR